MLLVEAANLTSPWVNRLNGLPKSMPKKIVNPSRPVSKIPPSSGLPATAESENGGKPKQAITSQPSATTARISMPESAPVAPPNIQTELPKQVEPEKIVLTCDDIRQKGNELAEFAAGLSDVDAMRIDRARRDVTARLQTIRTAVDEAGCGPSLKASIAGDMIQHAPVLLPLPAPGEMPLFGTNERQRLNKLAHDPLPDIQATGLREVTRVGIERWLELRQQSELKSLSDTLARARMTGRLTSRDDGAYLTGADYMSFAQGLPVLMHEVSQRQALLVKRQGMMAAVLWQAVLQLMVLPPAVFLILWIIVNQWQSRRDELILARLQHQKLAAILNALRTNHYSDKLRRRVVVLINNLLNLEECDLDLIEFLARDFRDRPAARDKKFALELSDVVTDLSNRVARRK
jgi:hypothetical protein